MANGSFGLSGIPTAPTTVGSAPNNALTPVSVAVNSVAGFPSGSLIYNRGGDYSTPVSATGTATFPITSTEPILSTTVPSWVATPSIASGSATVINNTGGSTGFSYAATLTNGNIVIGFRTNNQQVCFKIVDENYNVVVSQINTTMTAWSFCSAGVVALTGGGFVIYTIESSQNLQFCIYNNTGSLVAGPTTDTAQAFANNWIQVVARPDGSWISYGPGATTNFYYKVWSATGTQVYAWTSIGQSNAGGGQISISVRSDNSFVLLWPVITSGNITYAVRSATNTAIVAPTSTGVALSANQGITSVCLSTDAVVFIYQANSGTAMSIRTLSAANVLGSASTLLAQTTNIFGSTSHIDAYLLPSDNYLVSFENSISTSRFYYTTNYLVANSSGTILSGPTQLLNTQANRNNQNWNVFVRTTNYIHNVNYQVQNYSVTSNPNNMPMTMIGTRISPTTYQIVNNQSTTAVVGNTAAQAVSAYAPQISSVGAAGYYATTSGTITTSVSSTTGAITGTQIEAFAADTMDACSLTGGGVAILYYQVSTGTVKIAIYNVSMVLQTTISFTTGFTGTLSAFYKVTQLTNGKLVVTYQTTTNTYAFRIYSTSYALLATVTAPGASYNTSALSDMLGIAPLSGGRFVTVAKVSNQPSYAVFSDTGTTLVGVTTIDALGYGPTMVAANPSGFSFAGYYPGGGTSYLAHYYETTDQSNSFTSTGLANISSTIVTYDLKAVTAVNGSCLFPYVATSTQANIYCAQNTRGSPASSAGTSTNTSVGTTGTFATNSLVFVGAPCVGGAVIGGLDYNARVLQFVYQAGPVYGTSAGILTSLTFTNNDLASTSPTVAGGARFVGLYGNVMVFTYLNASRYPTYALINVNTASYNTTLVAGTTPSNATQTLSQATGYSLIGVSATDCPANGTGNVTINGSATLNGSYPETVAAQSFDFSSPTTFGVKGTQINRNINLQGNV